MSDKKKTNNVTPLTQEPVTSGPVPVGILVDYYKTLGALDAIKTARAKLDESEALHVVNLNKMNQALSQEVTRQGGNGPFRIDGDKWIITDDGSK